VKRLTKDDWATAALAALAEGGLAAVAIEPLAARLGATKGSAYWHFPNRAALVGAILDRWERESTEAVIALVESAADEPRARLRTLFETVLPQGIAHPVELALLASADDPLVEPVLRRITHRRLAYLTDQFAALGFAAVDARRRARLAYATYLGNAQLRRSAPGALPVDPAEWNAYVDDALRAFTTLPADG
jgi:AcrR family transcriptional regulator